MGYAVQRIGDYSLIKLSRAIDLQQSAKVRRCILEGLEQGVSMPVDLSAVEYIGSSGLASRVEGYQMAREHAVCFIPVGVSRSAMRRLQLTHLDRIFPMQASVNDYFAEQGY
jgi:anti-sigma B factor antagonist